MSLFIKGDITIEELQSAMLIFKGHEIIELLNHGDLIDRDVLCIKGGRNCGKMFLAELLKNEPVVIQAERSEDND